MDNGKIDYIALSLATKEALQSFGNDLWIIQDEKSIIIDASHDFIALLGRKNSINGMCMESISPEKIPIHTLSSSELNKSEKTFEIFTPKGLIEIKAQIIDLNQNPKAFLLIIRKV